MSNSQLQARSALSIGYDWRRVEQSKNPADIPRHIWQQCMGISPGNLDGFALDQLIAARDDVNLGLDTSGVLLQAISDREHESLSGEAPVSISSNPAPRL